MPKQPTPIQQRYIAIYGKYFTAFQLAARFGISEYQVKLYRGVVQKTWTVEEIAYVKANYKKLSNMRIGEVLGRTESSVKHYLSNNNLCRTAREQRKIFKNDISKRIVLALSDRNRRRKAKTNDILNAHGDMLYRKIELLQLVADAEENKSTENAQIVWAKKELEDIKRKEQEHEARFAHFMPTRKNNKYLV